MKTYIFLFLFLCISSVSAQVGIGTDSPDPSAVLDISATDQGVLIPRMSTTNRDAIASPANGLMIYNTDVDEIQFNFNTSAAPIWRALSPVTTSTATPGDSMKYSNTDTTTDLNPAPPIDLPVFGTAEWNDDAVLYAVTGNQVTVTSAGRYEIIVNVSLLNSAGTDRNAPEIRIAVNGTQVGSYGSTGYIRSNNGHEEASLHLREVLDLPLNAVVTVTIGRTANTGVVTMRSAGSSNFFIEKIL